MGLNIPRNSASVTYTQHDSTMQFVDVSRLFCRLKSDFCTVIAPFFATKHLSELHHAGRNCRGSPWRSYHHSYGGHNNIAGSIATAESEKCRNENHWKIYYLRPKGAHRCTFRSGIITSPRSCLHAASLRGKRQHCIK